MLLQFHPMIRSRLARIQSDWGDARLNGYILEHGYRWVRGIPAHEHFWSPPIFFPAPNTAAYSDVLLGVAPLYWPWRALGVLPDTAFQLWMLTIGTLNYVAAYLLFRRGFRCRPISSAVGALLLSFAAMRTAQVLHAQLLPIFYIVVAMFALLRLFEAERGEGNATWVWVLGVACVSQLYTSFYYTWFFALALVLAAMWACTFPDTRARLVEVIRTNLRQLVLTTLLAALTAAPLAAHFLIAAREVGMRHYDVVESMLPRLQSWGYLGPESWLYGPIAARDLFHHIPMEHEQRLGLGLATAAFGALGLYLGRRRRAVQLFVIVPLAMALLATEWPGGFSLWHTIYSFVPGAGALRAVSRIGIAILFPASLGVALLLDSLMVRSDTMGARASRFPARIAVPVAVVAIIGATVVEQVQWSRSYDKNEGRARVARIVELIGTHCTAFFYTTEGGGDAPGWYQLDAMWASMQSGMPTLNGYSGNDPPGYPLNDIRVSTPAQVSAIRNALDEWADKWHLDTARICRVHTPPG
jgi:hypothetical protein